MRTTSYNALLGNWPSITSAHAKGVEENLNEIDKIVIDARAETEQIDKSGHYSFEGKKSQRQILAEQIPPKLAKLRKERWDNRQIVANQLEQDIRSSDKTSQDPMDLLRLELRAAELRRYFESIKEPLEQIELIRDFADSGNAEAIGALRCSPVPYKVMGDEQVVKIVQDYDANALIRLNPEKAAELDSVRSAIEEVDAAEQQALRYMREELSIPVFHPSDPIKMLASSAIQDTQEPEAGLRTDGEKLRDRHIEEIAETLKQTA